ncbi:MAG: heme a synthase [Solirubrobacteraceae bacterium]|jgi:cytochrome c oxidase assembly protein subunit 15|nr:heme a synthase [Solirubrobacteraceae bacterium]
MRRRLPTLTPRAYQRVAEVALAALTLIVLTGAAVRLTGSGLGCPDWPKCYGGVAPPLETHAWIEYGNRLISGLVGLAAVAAGALAWRRRPFRRDLAQLGVLLPLGVVAQAVLGGFTVRNHLAPGYVMAHFALSMLILVAAAALAWRARHEPGEQPRLLERGSVWAVRALLPVGALAIFLGTAATAAGPHAGGAGTGDTIDRLEWKGSATLNWAIHQHARIATLLGLSVVAVYVLLRRRRAPADVLRPVAVTAVLLAVQGTVGAVQYALEVPAEIVWVHVALAALTWLGLLWSTAAAGRPVLASAPLPAAAEEAAEPSAAHVGAVLGRSRRVVR